MKAVVPVAVRPNPANLKVALREVYKRFCNVDADDAAE